MKKLLQRIGLGLSMGCTIFVLVGFALCRIHNTNVPFADSEAGFIQLACCSMIIGVGFTLPSVVYDSPKLARPMQILLHLSIGFIVFGLVAFGMGWVPASEGNAGFGVAGVGVAEIAPAPPIAPALVFVLVSVATTAIIWLCFYLYYKSEASKINAGIKKTQQQNQIISGD